MTEFIVDQERRWSQTTLIFSPQCGPQEGSSRGTISFSLPMDSPESSEGSGMLVEHGALEMEQRRDGSRSRYLTEKGGAGPFSRDSWEKASILNSLIVRLGMRDSLQ